MSCDPKTREELDFYFSSLVHFYNRHNMLPHEMVEFFLSATPKEEHKDYVSVWVSALEEITNRVRAAERKMAKKGITSYESAVQAIMELTDEERRILLSRWKAANHI